MVGLPVESRDAIEAALLRRAAEIAAIGPDDPGWRLMLDCAVNDVLMSLVPFLDAFADAGRDAGERAGAAAERERIAAQCEREASEHGDAADEFAGDDRETARATTTGFRAAGSAFMRAAQIARESS